MINCQWTPEELAGHLDAASKRYIAKNNIQLYTINAIDLAQSIGMGKRTNTILQSAFFSLAKVLPEEDAIKYMKEKATQSYSKKGMDVVEMNHMAIDAGATAYVKIDVPPIGQTQKTLSLTTTSKASPSLSSRLRTSSSRSIRWTATASAGFRVRRSCRRRVRTGRSRLRKTRRRCCGSDLGLRKVHPVQQLRLCLPARYHPHGRADR